MLQAAGVPTSGIRGDLRVRGLIGVWLWVMRTFDRDETEDLSPTMAALDTALARADQLASWMSGGRSTAAEPDESAVPEDIPPAADELA